MTRRAALPVLATDLAWWTYQEVADRLGYSVDTVERLTRSRELRFVQLLPGKRGRRIAGEELARWERSKVEATAAAFDEPAPAMKLHKARGKSLRELMAS